MTLILPAHSRRHHLYEPHAGLQDTETLDLNKRQFFRIDYDAPAVTEHVCAIEYNQLEKH